MDIIIRNFKNIARADITAAPIALVAAPNQYGKSSLCEATRAALTGDPLPLDGEGKRLTKKDSAPLLVRDGSDMGQAQIMDGENVASMIWPRCEFATHGKAPHATRHAAGLESFAEMPEKERAAYLVSLLKALPTKDDLAAGIKEKKIARGDEATEAVWKIIEQDGWDAALARAREKGARLKGQWEEVARTSYGDEKARDWRPDGWDPRFEDLTPEEAERGAQEVHDQLSEFDRKAGSQSAIHQTTRIQAERLEEIEKTPPKDVAGLKAKLDEARAARAALPPASILGDEVTCVACGHPQVAVRVGLGVKLAEKVALTEAQKEERRQAIAAAEKAVQDAERAYADAYAFNESLGRQKEEAIRAREKLATIPKSQGEADLKAREELVQRWQRASYNADLIKRRARCAEIRRMIADNQNLIALLAPTGLRQAAAARALTKFNTTLERLSTGMGADRVQVLEDMSVVQISRTDKRLPYWLMSESQKFRTRIVLQVAAALFDGSSMVVIDNDVDQDRRWINGTLKMLRMADVRAVITMRADRPEDAPTRLPPHVGRVWWIDERGETVPLADALAPQQQAAE